MRKREREGGTDRQTDRQTDKERETETERKTENCRKWKEIKFLFAE